MSARLGGSDDAYFFRSADFGVVADFPYVLEADNAGLRGEEGVILTTADVFARQVLGAALAQDNLAGDDGLSVVPFYPEPFRAGIPSVFC